MSLPSYKEAVRRPDPLDFVSKYLSTSDLVACCLVNKAFNGIFAKYLWANPLRVIGNGSKPIPFHLDKYRLFSKSAAATRESVKYLVETLDYREQWIPKMYALPQHVGKRALNADVGYWNSQRIVYKLLQALPSHFRHAKFLFFDGIDLYPASIPTSECRPLLLSLHGCQNTVVVFASDANDFLRETIYLDISHTILRNAYGATEYRPSHLMLPNLRVLKVQGVGLRDADLREIFSASPHQLQLSSLDVRDNRLTDESVAEIENHLIWRLNTDVSSNIVQPNPYFEEPPPYTERSRAEEEQEGSMPEVTHLPPDSPETFIQHACQHSNSADIIPCTGLTVLYLSGNAFTSDAFLRLLKASDHLQVLDLDAVFKATGYSDDLTPSESRTPNLKPSSIPTVTRLLTTAHSPRISSLRAHHSLVTHTPTLQPALSSHPTAHALLSTAIASAPPQSFLPDTNPHLTSLTLVGIPASAHPDLLTRLKDFILAAAAQERAIARARSAGGGRRRGAKMREGLKVLRLELGGEVAGSVSEDRDADAFAALSAGDFSFFEEEKREEKGGGGRETVDVRGELRRWRGEMAKAEGGERHWSGRLEVVLRAVEEEGQ